MRARRVSPSRSRVGSAGDRLDLARSSRPAALSRLALLIVVGAALAWFGARETGVFAVARSTSRARPRAWRPGAKRASRRREGTSLLEVDLDAAQQTVEALPTVASARFDRAFPHTLRVVVVPEHAVAVVRQGADSYLVAESGRVMATVERRDRPALARIWVKRDVQLQVGARAEGDLRPPWPPSRRSSGPGSPVASAR